VPNIGHHEKRFAEKGLLAFPGFNVVPLLQLRCVPGVPIKTLAPRESIVDIVGHRTSIYAVYT